MQSAVYSFVSSIYVLTKIPAPGKQFTLLLMREAREEWRMEITKSSLSL